MSQAFPAASATSCSLIKLVSVCPSQQYLRACLFGHAPTFLIWAPVVVTIWGRGTIYTSPSLQGEIVREHVFTVWRERVTHTKPPPGMLGWREEPYNSVCPRESAVAQARLSLESEQPLLQMESSWKV